MSRKLLAALALCSVFIGGTAMAQNPGDHHTSQHDIHHGRNHHPWVGRHHHMVVIHHYHHPIGRRSHGH